MGTFTKALIILCASVYLHELTFGDQQGIQWGHNLKNFKVIQQGSPYASYNPIHHIGVPARVSIVAPNDTTPPPGWLESPLKRFLHLLGYTEKPQLKIDVPRISPHPYQYYDPQRGVFVPYQRPFHPQINSQSPPPQGITYNNNVPIPGQYLNDQGKSDFNSPSVPVNNGDQGLSQLPLKNDIIMGNNGNLPYGLIEEQQQGSPTGTGLFQETGNNFQQQLEGPPGHLQETRNNFPQKAEGSAGHLEETGNNFQQQLEGSPGHLQETRNNFPQKLEGSPGQFQETGNNFPQKAEGSPGQLQETGNNFQQLEGPPGQFQETGNNFPQKAEGSPGQLQETGNNFPQKAEGSPGQLQETGNNFQQLEGPPGKLQESRNIFPELQPLLPAAPLTPSPGSDPNDEKSPENLPLTQNQEKSNGFLPNPVVLEPNLPPETGFHQPSSLSTATGGSERLHRVKRSSSKFSVEDDEDGSDDEAEYSQGDDDDESDSDAYDEAMDEALKDYAIDDNKGSEKTEDEEKISKPIRTYFQDYDYHDDD